MDIIVCIKRVPDTNEADLQIAGTSINTKGLAFDLNEWDKYAVEEAVRLKEKLGGTVTAVTLGGEDSEDVLRRAFATGADNGIRISDEGCSGTDLQTRAEILAAALKDLKYDLILFGAQSSDDSCGSTGQMVASLMGLPYTTLATSLETSDSSLKVSRELEAGMHETVEIPMPALVTVQSGINEPRYVSIMGIRKASRKEIALKTVQDLGLDPSAPAATEIKEMFVPEALKQAEFLTGSIEEMSSMLARILKDKGGTI